MAQSVNPLQALRAWVDQHDTQQAAATALDIAPSYLSELLSARRDAPEWLLKRLGLQTIVVKVPRKGRSLPPDTDVAKDRRGAISQVKRARIARSFSKSDEQAEKTA